MAAAGFANYLAHWLIAAQDYTTDLPPEAAPLLAHSDVVLCRNDGFTLQFFAIIDLEAHPDKRFGLTAEDIWALAAACEKYCGRLSGRRFKPGFSFAYCGPGSDRPELLDWFKVNLPQSADVPCCGWLIDPAAQCITASNKAMAQKLGGRALRRMLARPREDMSSLRLRAIERLQPVALPPAQPPYVTYALLLLLPAVYALGAVLSADPASSFTSMSVETLINMGGMNSSLLLQQHEWFRLFMAPFLHGGLLHLFMNGLVLFLLGPAAERVMGHVWFAFIYLASGVAGAVGTLIFMDGGVGIGASGAIMGILAGLMVAGQRLGLRDGRQRIQSTVMQVLVPSLIPISSHTDYAAHGGGAVCGAMLGYVLLKSWPRLQFRPPFEMAALSLAVLLSGISMAAAAQAFEYFTAHNTGQAVEMAPRDVLAQPQNEVYAHIAETARRYPHDPRVLTLQGAYLVAHFRPQEANEVLRRALDERALTIYYKPGLRDHITVLLAISLTMSGDREEAKKLMAPLCGKPLELQRQIDVLKLCDATP